MKAITGEDVKEYYFYLDNTPTHSYMKYLYKYPHAAYPYEQLLDENRRRTRYDPEYELVDTGIFNQSRYFDVLVEYAKLGPEDLLIRLKITNRGPEPAPLHVLPTLWFRNTWAWSRDDRRPSLSLSDKIPPKDPKVRSILANHWDLGEYLLYCSAADEFLFTENETNNQRLFGVPSRAPYVKDAFHYYLIAGNRQAINPAQLGTKAAADYYRQIPAGQTVSFQLRLAALVDNHPHDDPFADFDANLQQRRAEADEFYGVVLPSALSADAKLVARQAFAGMLWSKQYYHYVVTDWLQGDPASRLRPPKRLKGRNSDWTHFFTRDVLSMPDKWEFPVVRLLGPGFSLRRARPCRPAIRQGSNSPDAARVVHASQRPNSRLRMGLWRCESAGSVDGGRKLCLKSNRHRTGVADYVSWSGYFKKCCSTFTWWVNRKDALGNNIFQGGFLGMDNIGAFDRDNFLPATCSARPTAQVGWPPSPRSMLVHRLAFSPNAIPSTKILPANFGNTTSTSPISMNNPH